MIKVTDVSEPLQEHHRQNITSHDLKIYDLPDVQNVSQQVLTKLFLVSIICILFLIAEVVGGLYAGSLAILSDAAHMFSDLSGFMISIFSIWLGQRPASKIMSFGYHRAEVIGALASIILIWCLTILLFYQATDRIIMKEPVNNPLVMVITAVFGLFCNLVMARVLHSSPTGEHKGHDHGGHFHSHDHSHSHGGHSHHNHSHEQHSHDANQPKVHKLNKSISQKKQKKKFNDNKQIELSKVDYEKQDNQCSEVCQYQEHQDEYNSDSESTLSDSESQIYKKTQNNEKYKHKTSTHKRKHKHDCNHDNKHKHDHNHDQDHNRKDKHIQEVKDHSNSSEKDHYRTSDHENHQRNERARKNKSLTVVNANENYNLRAAMIHVIGDILQSIGVLIAALLIYFFGQAPEGKFNPWMYADPICTYLFSILVLLTTFGVAKECLIVIMEATPIGFVPQEFEEAIQSIEQVKEIHDFHVWSLSVGKPSMSAHLVVYEGHEAKVLQKATIICRQFGIYHSTIQIEEEKMHGQNDYIRCIHNLH